MPANVPVLVMLTGLPGVGKSTLAHKLRAHYAPEPVALLASDQMRKALFARPCYSDEENEWVHTTIRHWIGGYLRRGQLVIYDATNLQQRHRDAGAAAAHPFAALTIEVVAPEATVRERLERRRQDPTALSDADWRVYRLLEQSVEPAQGPVVRVLGVDGFAADFGRITAAINHARSQ